MSVIAKAGQEVDITKIPPQQLQELGKALDEEVKQLATHYQQLIGAVRKFSESKSALKYMDANAEGKEIMVPLTSSLYVPGRMDDHNHVLIEAGAGYFIEKDTNQALEYCDRKAIQLSESGNKVNEIIQHKKAQLQKVQAEFQGRVQAMQKMQAEAAQKQ